MRVGENPAKGAVIENKAYHRIIVPVYVPNLEGYFKDSLEVTRLCLESLITTIHDATKITVINNGSCESITHYLQSLYKAGTIDQLVHQQTNLGKIDAMIAIATTSTEPLITLSDADVFFTSGWQQEVESVFSNFPEAGMVSPVPHGTVYSAYTTNTIFDALVKGGLTFQSLCNKEALLHFAKSIGREDTMYKDKRFLTHQLTVSRKGKNAIVGCGHFVATLRNEVFQYVPKDKSNLAYHTHADRDYIDIPVEKAGLWRLATVVNGAYHIGNLPDSWMHTKTMTNSNSKIAIPKSKVLFRNYTFKKFFVEKLLLNKYVKPRLLKKWGLPKK